ncbi:hypothetical protein MMC10_001415 [Thelotrema lepadinum]|nr:hypothetical protein [Thelotrema lepadinum]
MYIDGGISNSEKPTNATVHRLGRGEPAMDNFDSVKHAICAPPSQRHLIAVGNCVGDRRGTQEKGFNNSRAGGPVHKAELWRPSTNQWTLMAEERADRCYYSIALLLPDGRVLSAGGGECSDKSNAVVLDLTSAQLFRPPCLFKDGRPTILDAPSEIDYG